MFKFKSGLIRTNYDDILAPWLLSQSFAANPSLGLLPSAALWLLALLGHHHLQEETVPHCLTQHLPAPLVWSAAAEGKPTIKNGS